MTGNVPRSKFVLSAECDFVIRGLKKTTGGSFDVEKICSWYFIVQVGVIHRSRQQKQCRVVWQKRGTLFNANTAIKLAKILHKKLFCCWWTKREKAAEQWSWALSNLRPKPDCKVSSLDLIHNLLRECEFVPSRYPSAILSLLARQCIKYDRFVEKYRNRAKVVGVEVEISLNLCQMSDLIALLFHLGQN